MADKLFSPTIEKPGFKGYVAPPIVNKGDALASEAMSNLIGGLTSNVIEGVDKYQKEKTLKGVAENVGDIIREQEERSIQGQINLEEQTKADQAQINQVQQDLGYNSTYPTMLNQELTDRTRDLQNNLVEKTDKLARAKEQGIMKEDEFRERFNKIIRESIAANPAYAGEIMAHAKTVADQHDLSYKVKRDEKALQDIQKAEADNIKDILQRAKETGVYVDSPKYQLFDGKGYDLQAIIRDADELNQQKQYNQAVEYSVKNNEAIGKINAQAAIDQGLHYTLVDARLTQLDQDLSDIINQNLPAADAATLIENTVNSNIADTNRFFSINGLRNSDIDEAKTFLKTKADAMKDLYNKVSTKAIDAERAKNELESLRKTREFRLLDKNPELIDLQIMSEAAGDLAPRVAYNIVNKLENQILSILTKTPASYSDEGKQKKNDKEFEVVPEYSKKTPPVQVLDQVIKFYNNGSADPNKVESQFTKVLNYIDTTNPKHGPEAVRDLMNTLGNPTSKQAIDNMSSETLSRLSTLVGQYTTPLANAYQDFVQNYPDAELKVMPDSGKMIINNLTNEYKQFNSNGLRSINEAFKAYHAVSGNSSVAQSADEFYSIIQQQPSNNNGEPIEKK